MTVSSPTTTSRSSLSPPMPAAQTKSPAPAHSHAHHPEGQQPPRRRLLPGPLFLKQKLYLLFPQTLGAMILDGGLNFAIAYGMYHRQTLVEVWPIQHNTIAGDMAVTTFIQGILTFFIVSGMVHSDLRKRSIDPFPEPWPYSPSEKERAWQAREAAAAAEEAQERERSPSPGTRHLLWHMRVHHPARHHALHTPYQWFCGSDLNDVFDFSLPFSDLSHRFLRTVLEGALLSALYFLLLWPVGIAIVAPLWPNGKIMAGTWAPEAIKALYGGILGLIMNPVCAMIAMGSEDAVGRRKVRELEEGLGAQGEVMTQVRSRCPHCSEGAVSVVPVQHLTRPEEARVAEHARPQPQMEVAVPPAGTTPTPTPAVPITSEQGRRSVEAVAQASV